MEHEISERFSNIEHIIGIDKNGNPNYNGMISSIREIKNDLDDISLYIDEQKIEKTEFNNRLENIEKDIKRMHESLKYIESSLKDNINMQSFIKLKNVILGIAAVLGAFGAIGAFLYNFLKIIYERGN